MLKGTKAISLNYSSVVRVNEQDVDVVYMNAQIGRTGAARRQKRFRSRRFTRHTKKSAGQIWQHLTRWCMSWKMRREVLRNESQEWQNRKFSQ